MQVMFEACVSGTGRELASFAQFYSIFLLVSISYDCFYSKPIVKQHSFSKIKTACLHSFQRLCKHDGERQNRKRWLIVGSVASECHEADHKV